MRRLAGIAGVVGVAAFVGAAFLAPKILMVAIWGLTALVIGSIAYHIGVGCYDDFKR